MTRAAFLCFAIYFWDQYTSRNSVQQATTADKMSVSFDFLRRMAVTSELTTGNLAPRLPSLVDMSMKRLRCPASEASDWQREEEASTGCAGASAHRAASRRHTRAGAPPAPGR